MRSFSIERNTSETKINLKLCIDGNGNSSIKSGCGFMDHMLTLFAKHGCFDLDVNCIGDTYVDYHHSVEDIGICLGKAFKESLGDKKGIKRYGYMILPMDEALILSSVDISGRAFIDFDVDIPTDKVGDFDTELAREFFIAFTRSAEITLHVRKLAGYNSHHIIEGAFKCVARALKEAVEIDIANADSIPSTKGVL